MTESQVQGGFATELEIVSETAGSGCCGEPASGSAATACCGEPASESVEPVEAVGTIPAQASGSCCGEPVAAGPAGEAEPASTESQPKKSGGCCG